LINLDSQSIQKDFHSEVLHLVVLDNQCAQYLVQYPLSLEELHLDIISILDADLISSTSKNFIHLAEDHDTDIFIIQASQLIVKLLHILTDHLEVETNHALNDVLETIVYQEIVMFKL